MLAFYIHDLGLWRLAILKMFKTSICARHCWKFPAISWNSCMKISLQLGSASLLCKHFGMFKKFMQLAGSVQFLPNHLIIYMTKWETITVCFHIPSSNVRGHSVCVCTCKQLCTVHMYGSDTALEREATASEREQPVHL